MRERSGYAFTRRGSIWVRATLTDPRLGKRREIVRKVRPMTKAELSMDADALAKAKLGKRIERDQAVKKKLAEILSEAERAVNGEDVETFGQLAARFLSDYAKDAVFVGGEKVGGMRSASTVRDHVRMLRREIGDAKKLRRITYDDLRQLKEKRWTTTTRNGAERSRATVHRELSILRRMLSVAKTNGWIDENPFNRGEALILNSTEKKRERILTKDEEARLLLHCSHAARRHILPLVIAALDTAARRGELLKLRWRNVDLKASTMTFVARNTKTERERSVRIPQRLHAELQRLAKESGAHASSLVFGIDASVRRAFNTAKRLAGLDDVRFHDLRHTAASRLVAGHLALPEVGRILGHTQAETTYRYSNIDGTTRERAANILDDFNAGPAIETVN